MALAQVRHGVMRCHRVIGDGVGHHQGHVHTVRLHRLQVIVFGNAMAGEFGYAKMTVAIDDVHSLFSTSWALNHSPELAKAAL